MQTTNKAGSNRLIPVRTGEIYNLTISGLGHSGEGVGRIEQFTIFVPGALPDELVKIRIQNVKKTYASAHLLQIITPSTQRVQPQCPVYKSCGGCQLQHLSYTGQLAAKQQVVVDAITRIAKLNADLVQPIIGAAEPWYYRNKMQAPVGLTSTGAAIGCFAQGTHTIIDAPDCLIQHQLNNRIAQAMKQIITELKLSVYDESTHQGNIRHVLGRVGIASGEAMAVLVTATPELPHKQEIITRLRAAVPELVSIVHNINNRRTNVVLGATSKTIWGKANIIDCLAGLSFQISAKSFFQVNSAQAALLYQQAVTYAQLSGKEIVCDLYCGTGTIALFLARHCKQVLGIEIVADAIIDANANAALNNITNVEFRCGDATTQLAQLTERYHADVVVLDPPRAGCDPRLIAGTIALSPERIVYVSCNPASLARDLALFSQGDYIVQKIQPVDLFPQTFHVESVVSMKRNNSH